MSTLKHLVHHRPRLLIGMAVGVLVGLFLPVGWKSVTQALMAWNAGVGFYLSLVIWLMLRATQKSKGSDSIDLRVVNGFQACTRHCRMGLTGIQQTR